jgi:hypothetical protein
MILFYQSFYGLRANDLSKFAPPEKSATSSRDGGEYFKAYFNLVAAVHPEPHKSKAITPHIDRWWHVPTHMPDLDDENQALTEQQVFASMFWSLAGKLVYLCDKGTEKQRYMLDGSQLGFDEGYDTFVVSNGTPCDHLYEVLDALSIYPELVTRVLAYVEQRTARDVYEGNDIGSEENMLTDFLESFRIDEYVLDGAKEHNIVRSIFDLPLLLRRSARADHYYEEYVLRVFNATIVELKKYIARLYSSKDLPDAMGGVVMSQFDRFLAGIVLEEKAYRDIYHDHLFTKICNGVQKALEDLSLRKEALSIKKRVEDLRK